jgi:hypothetical protein
VHGFAGLARLGLDDRLGAFEDRRGRAGRGTDRFVVAHALPIGLLLALVFHFVLVHVFDELGKVLRGEATLRTRVQVFHGANQLKHEALSSAFGSFTRPTLFEGSKTDGNGSH